MSNEVLDLNALNQKDPPKFRENFQNSNVFKALLGARGKFGAKRQIIVDVDETPVDYATIIRGAMALGNALKKGTKPGENIGVILPTGAGAVITFFGLNAYGRVPAMLNFTAGAANIRSACTSGDIKRIVTAKRFVDQGGFEDLMADLEKDFEVIYLEDVRENLSLGDKVAGGLGPILPFLFRKKPKPDTPAVVLFTSGTEGAPKGVVLSHRNLLVNTEQVITHIHLDTEQDKLLNPLPAFHSFGLTVGSVLPVIAGITSVFHPSPLQPREIVKRVKDHNITIMIATDTFMQQYARVGKEGDLSSVRLAVLGAERVRDETRKYVRDKYNIELLEGYGATETAPVAAANTLKDNRPGTVGKLMEGMEARLVPVEGIEKGGTLHLRGPNVMLGYLKEDKPGIIQPPEEGWHDTGDIVEISDEGYISIKGRQKRFAKIGGEMVSLTVVENCASALWPDNMHAAMAISDARKGEQIILVTDSEQANREEFIGWLKNHGVTELAAPRKILKVDEIPVLGTGKTDYPGVEKLMQAHDPNGK